MFRSLQKIEEILRDRKADYISMARSFIRVSGLIKRRFGGEKTKATCISCNGYFETGLKGIAISCEIDREKAELAYS